ncbi:hypothetical protein [Streptomyces iranensis]
MKRSIPRRRPAGGRRRRGPPNGRGGTNGTLVFAVNTKEEHA